MQTQWMTAMTTSTAHHSYGHPDHRSSSSFFVRFSSFSRDSRALTHHHEGAKGRKEKGTRKKKEGLIDKENNAAVVVLSLFEKFEVDGGSELFRRKHHNEPRPCEMFLSYC